MKTFLRSIILISFFITFSFATTINVPADTSTIQGGINLANPGDTVLVQPGTYLETINFNGKNIVVGSLTLTTGDTSHISQTVIDGGQYTSAVRFKNGEDSTALLTGFTITNGGGTMIYPQYWLAGGGIYIENSGPTLSYLLIKNNEIPTIYEVGGPGGGIYCKNSNSKITDSEISENICMVGGGIFCDSSNITLMNVKIMNNESTTMHPDCNNGGGIYFTNSNPVLINVKVIGNDGGYGAGGGIFCNNSSPRFSNVTISNNFVQHKGGGIYFADGPNNAFFDSINRCNIYNNHSNHNGKDLYSECDSIITIVVDTFSVLNPDTTYAFPLNKFTFDILHDTSGNANSIERINNLPTVFSLNQNYPNPFNPSTKIKYTLPKSDKVKMEIFNLLGQRIETLINKQMPAGSHEIEFIAKDLPSGVYLYRIESGNPSVGSGQRFQEVKKMVLLK